MKNQESTKFGEMKSALKKEQQYKVEFLRLLSGADRTKSFLEWGYSSLFSMCTSGLKLSRSSALKRIVAARTATRFDLIFSLLESGKIHLNAVVLLSPYLTCDNSDSLLQAAEEKSERELEKWLSGQFPKEAKENQEKLNWLDGEKAEWTLIVDSELMTLLERAKELMKHKYPKGESVSILKDVLKKHLSRIDPLLRTPRKTRTSPVTNPKPSNIQTRYIPRGIQTEVWKRDEGRCRYVSPDGKRCDERAGIEQDHAHAWAQGGTSELPNIRLLCFAHNRWLAQKLFPNRIFSRPVPGP
jgi:5-methylcytosine-specific restriction endonuclease McrA